jgi:hypothetical protein
MESLKNRISSLEGLVHIMSKRIATLEDMLESSNNVKKSTKSSSSSSHASGRVGELFSNKASVKEKKTNHPGPGSWNEFVKVIWREMLEEEGHEIPEDDDEFKKLANQVGITYKQALTEAAKRKAEKEGREFVQKPKSNKKEEEDAKAEEEELFGEDEDEELTKEMKSIGCMKKMIDETVYYYNPKSKEVFDMTADRVGMLIKGKIDETK